jgi:hypothetical protein
MQARRAREAVVLVVGKRLAVFSIRKTKTGTVWVRAGNAYVNRDGSMNVWLDVLPLNGELHVREAAEKKEAAPTSAEMVNQAADAANSMGGH